MHEIKMIALPGGKPSLIGSIEVAVGDRITKDQVLFVTESAKGTRQIKSQIDGEVAEIKVAVGDQVQAEDVLLIIKENTGEEPEKEKPVEKEMITKNYDLVIIGAGPGGYVAAIYAAMNGLRVALVEKGKLGGTCLNVGCIPTKSLLESASLYEKMKEASIFGVIADNIRFDFKKMMERKEEVMQTLHDGIAFLLKKHEIDVIEGHAHFEEGLLRVSGEKEILLTYRDLILAMGAKQAKLPIEGIDLSCILTSEEALSLSEVPNSLTIIGGGVIGMEFAFLYHALGVKVHVVEFLDHILSTVDREAANLLLEIAKRKGIMFSLSSRVEQMEQTDNGIAVVSYRKEGTLHKIASEKVLLAVGRVPNSDGMGLESLGISIEKGAILVDEQMRTNKEHIFAIGDVTGILQLAHVASHQGMVAVDTILGKKKKMEYNAVPAVIFTSPEIATVGVCAEDGKHRTSRFDFSGNGKALVKQETEGFVKLVKEKETEKLVGGVIIGPDASTMINTLTLAIKENMSEKELCETIFPHPTTGEAVHEAAMGLGIGMLHQ